MVMRPSLLTPTGSSIAFRPSDTASAAKIDYYIYLKGTYPKHRIDIDLFKDQGS